MLRPPNKSQNQRLLSLMLWKTQFTIWISPSCQSWRNRANYSIFHHCTSNSCRKQCRSLMAIDFKYDFSHSISICRSRFKVNSSGIIYSNVSIYIERYILHMHYKIIIYKENIYNNLLPQDLFPSRSVSGFKSMVRFVGF